MEKKELIKNAVFGLAVGDAFGMPYETAKRGSFDIRSEADDGCGGYIMKGYKVGMPAYWYENDMPSGTWTDDTAMVLAEMESVIRLGMIDLDDLMKNFCRWHFDNKFTPFGKSIGQGRRTIAALERYREGVPAENCGGTEPEDNGNGSLMRMLPFAFLGDMMKRDGITVRHLSALTHGHDIALTACEIFVKLTSHLADGADKNTLIQDMKEYPAPFDRLKNIASLPEHKIKSTGYVVDSLEAALWCFFNSDSYEECILKAINLGGDTDTIAAIAGSMAGLCYQIPEKLIDQLARKDYISKICEDFAETISSEI